jgi:adenylosuccinate lyase
MRVNLERSRGMVFSQGLLLSLIEKGLTREEAYALVQEAAKQVWENKDATLDAVVLKDARILKHLTPEEIKKVFPVPLRTHVTR